MAFIYEKVKIGNLEGAEIRGYEGTAKKLSVPETIDGLPVISIGKNAFTDKNKGIAEVILPKSIVCIRSFAFYFCNDIHKISLHDHVDDYYDGAIRTSSGIREIEIEMEEDKFELIRRILEDSDRKMRVLFRFPNRSLQLVFPDYNSNTIADPRAQTFHIRIEGSGFSYRECVRNDGVRIKEYDSLFRKTLSADVPDISLEIAMARLQYPDSLLEDSEQVYRKHIKENMSRVLELAVLPDNTGWMETLVNAELLDENDMDKALRLVSELRLDTITGLLMEYRNTKLKKETKGKLSLSDLDDFDF